MIDITDVKVIEPFVVLVTFADGTRRPVNVEPVLWGPVFEPLRDYEFFCKARFDPELGTVIWPNEADLAPEFLLEHGQLVAPSRFRTAGRKPERESLGWDGVTQGDRARALDQRAQSS
jgi:hypothetical protein